MALKKGSTSLFRKYPKTTNSKKIPFGHNLSRSIGAKGGYAESSQRPWLKRRGLVMTGMVAIVALTYSCHAFFTPKGKQVTDAPADAAQRTNTRDDLPAEVAARQTAQAYSPASSGERRVWRYYLPGGIGSKAIIAKLYHDSCIKDPAGKTELRSVSLWFTSPAGRHQADFQLATTPSQAGVSQAAPGQTSVSQAAASRVTIAAPRWSARVTLADTAFSLKAPLPGNLNLLCGLRDSHDEHNGQFPVIDRPMVNAALALLSKTAPDCKMSFDPAKGFACDLSGRTIRGLEGKLGHLQRRILNHSKRHPYLLVRRIAVAMLASRLADSRLSASRFDRERTNFCNILEYSLPLELPLVLRTPTVKTRVCDPKAERKTLAPMIHLVASDAYREIDGVFQVYKASSRIGKVSLRLKGERKIGRHLWMELTPVLDGSNATRAPVAVGGSRFAISQCFHPLYSASSPIYVDYVSKLLPVASGCQQLLTDQGDPLAFSRYRHEAISSETEFAISDGWSKVLNLPPGKYRYEIRPKKARVGNERTASRDRSVTGVLEWGPKRNVLIR